MSDNEKPKCEICAGDNRLYERLAQNGRHYAVGVGTIQIDSAYENCIAARSPVQGENAPAPISEDTVRKLVETLASDEDARNCICTGKREQNPDENHCRGCMINALLSTPELAPYLKEDTQCNLARAEAAESQLEQAQKENEELRAKFKEADERHVVFMVKGGPVVMESEYNRLKEELEIWKKDERETFAAEEKLKHAESQLKQMAEALEDIEAFVSPPDKPSLQVITSFAKAALKHYREARKSAPSPEDVEEAKNSTPEETARLFHETYEEIQRAQRIIDDMKLEQAKKDASVQMQERKNALDWGSGWRERAIAAESQLKQAKKENEEAQKDWMLLLFRISEAFAQLDRDWEDATIHDMGEFDPWEAMRQIKTFMHASEVNFNKRSAEWLLEKEKREAAESLISQLMEALEGVIRESDRNTNAYIKAKAALKLAEARRKE